MMPRSSIRKHRRKKTVGSNWGCNGLATYYRQSSSFMNYTFLDM